MTNKQPEGSAAESGGLGQPAGARPGGLPLLVLADGSKVKRRRLRMRACDEPNAKGKICAGHLKRWYRPSPAAAEALGPGAELYRCERCRTIYLPNPGETPRTRTLAW